MMIKEILPCTFETNIDIIWVDNLISYRAWDNGQNECMRVRLSERTFVFVELQGLMS